MECPLVVVTGASSGIGEATAERLARSGGYRLMLAGRDHQRLTVTSTKCLAAGAPEVTMLPGDLRDREYVRRLAEESANRVPVGALVNSAGVGEFGDIARFSDDAWDGIIAVNLAAVFWLCRGLAEPLAAGDSRGTIVMVSSDADSVGFAKAAAYCASKGGLRAMARALRLEMQPRAVRVCTVSPGRVDTYFNSKAPGMRPGALTAGEVAEVIQFAIECSPNIELQEIALDSMGRVAAQQS